MDVEAADARFRTLLAEEGVDPVAPAPAAAWTAFKRFAAEPIDGLDPADDRDRLLFEAGPARRGRTGHRSTPPSSPALHTL
jgi:hypothetical protein